MGHNRSASAVMDYYNIPLYSTSTKCVKVNTMSKHARVKFKVYIISLYIGKAGKGYIDIFAKLCVLFMNDE